MKKIIIAIVLLLMFGYSLYEFIDPFTEDETVNREANTGLGVGQYAPDFELKNLAGETVNLSDYRGKRVMLNFWATWCPPCRAEMPDMEKFYQQNEVEVLAVNLTSTEEREEDVHQFADEFDLSFSILLDTDLTASTRYEIRPVPTSYMIDSHGIIQHKALGALNYEQMVQALKQME